MPQDTRLQPRSSNQRAMVGNAGYEAAVEGKSMPFGIRQTRPQQTVAPASFSSDDANGNPLRGSQQRPIGSGVAEAQE